MQPASLSCFSHSSLVLDANFSSSISISSREFLPVTPLVDKFDRLHDNLRISVTDRCNIRCFYCMPETDVKFEARENILSFEEIERFVRSGSSG